MPGHEPRIIIETREELIYLLAEAAAIEHNLLCTYLYAAWSLKRGTGDGLQPDEAEAVQRWRRVILSVAVEEMTHLTLACNLTSAVGGAPHFSRPNFPVPAGYHPDGVVVALAPFSRAALDHFIFLERPEGSDGVDSSEYPHPAHHVRRFVRGSLMPSAQDYATVGHLYRGLRHGLAVLTKELGERALFCGDPASQLGPDDVALEGVQVISDLASAEAAIETIVEQGEGAPSHRDDSHYSRFVAVRDEYYRLSAARPAFAPAFPVAHNPVLRPPTDVHDRVHIDNPEAAHVLDLANAVYGHMLRCLVQSYGRGRDGEAGKHLYAGIGTDLMPVVDALGSHLASLPAGPSHSGIHAGMTFTMLRDVAKLPPGPGEARFMAERLLDMARHADQLFPAGHALAFLSARLVEIAGKIEVAAAPGAGDAFPHPRPEESQGDVAAAMAGDVTVAEGRELAIRFDGRRCIHARFCVLGAPDVFKANTPGEWIFPDAMATSAIVEVAHQCPSGAIQYRRKDGGPQEPAPPVNTARIRENGPYALHAPLRLKGADIGYRAVLCRCGQSKNKPFCDNSHIAAGFKATGEPERIESAPLAARDGTLELEPLYNGPLLVTGNLEIVSGTGKTIRRVTRAHLCRCGGSRNKPFCDGTHNVIGFKAPA
jgi:CDGSH-type Zn-finger protein/uncharacterized Fe-S cluster protein YjdI